MKNEIFLIQNDQSIEISIQLINDLTVYAHATTHITLKLCESIKSYPFQQKGTMSDFDESRYLEDIANIVSQFNQMINLAIGIETEAIKRKEDLLNHNITRKILGEWQPLAVFTQSWIKASYQVFQQRIDQRSKAFLNRTINRIEFKEVQNGYF